MGRITSIFFVALIALLFLINFLLGLSLLILFILILFIAMVAAFTIITWFPQLFNTINKLAEYLPLIKEEYDLDNYCLYENFNENCSYGENFKKKVENTFWANFKIAFALYLTLTYIIYAVPDSLFDFSAINGIKILFWTYPVSHSQPNFSVSYIAFIITFFMIPAFLLSFRFLANPTRLWFHKNNHISRELELKQINFFKEQVISFYFSFIASTIIIFYLSILYLATKYQNPIDIRLLLPFSTSMDLLAYFLMILLEVVVIYAISYCEEKYFEKFEPIDQKEIWKSPFLMKTLLLNLENLASEVGFKINSHFVKLEKVIFAIKQIDSVVLFYGGMGILLIIVGASVLGMNPPNLQVGYPTIAVGFAFFVFAYSQDNSIKSAKKSNQILAKLDEIHKDLQSEKKP